MATRNIIVIGASAGGFEALKTLVKGLPKDLEAAIFVVWHIPANSYGVLPMVLEKAGSLPATHAVDGEEIKMGRIYVAQPDRHLLVDGDKIRVTKGPKENRFRPAVDPLFRSAAYSFGERVIGVILSGALDDGTAGLWTIKLRGGVAVVQHPADAEFSSMPQSAMREVEVDYAVPIAEMAGLLNDLTKQQISEAGEIRMEKVSPEENKKNEIEISIAAQDKAFELGVMQLGEISPFTCPDCHGVLTKLRDGKLTRFRCHTGHAFSADALLTTLTETIEDSMWSAMRGIEESIMLLNHISEHFAESGQMEMAELSRKKAFEAQNRAAIIREAIMRHEQLSEDTLRHQVGV
ncbi:MAG TPA: chemotaxis protein CheB [Pyrinomonadaceae bacterium]|jgi:two-component system chemotaxis response regulator CheB